MQRYGADELDRIADENRDRAIGELTRLNPHTYPEPRAAIMAEVQARIMVAEFCRRDATRIRQFRAEHSPPE